MIYILKIMWGLKKEKKYAIEIMLFLKKLIQEIMK